MPPDSTMAQFALRWTLMHDGVTVHQNVRQAREDAAASDLARLSAETMTSVVSVYEQRVKRFVHQRW